MTGILKYKKGESETTFIALDHQGFAALLVKYHRFKRLTTNYLK
jgi:hypothetical protein